MGPLVCKSCRREMDYNRYYHCYECECGKTYNAVGEEIRPVEEWKDEYDED